ncbi:hypothetical protein RRG08_025917 [Elysia crispata]|uniref:RAD51 interacting motif domain-containing protein n=1 Tax=Elysia crispata TaxID=231223 RepID=A0AAE1AIW8_9GAST|nr:hypothetical protein RRG08_025917 [Elysia crispata]
MTERRSSRSKKAIKYSAFEELSDDDFADTTPPPPKKQRGERSTDKKVPAKNKEVSLCQTVADVYESDSSKKRRIPLSDKIYERELQQALEISLLQSQDSDTKRTKSHNPVSELDRTKDIENKEPTGAALKHVAGVVVDDKIEPLVENVENPNKVTRDRPQRCSTKQGKQKTAPVKGHLKLESNDEDDYASDDSSDNEEEGVSDDDSDFGYDSKPAKKKRTPVKKAKTTSKADKNDKGKIKPSVTPSTIKARTSSVSAKAPESPSLSKATGSLKKISSAPSRSLPVPSSLTSSWKPPAFSSPGSSSLSAVKSPTSGLRLGLSRNQRVKSLHPSIILSRAQMAKSKANTSTHNELDIFRTNSKELLVIRDPLFVHPSIKDGHYVGREPHSYFPLAVFVTVINPALGPIALIFALMSKKSYKDGDLLYAVKWSNYAFLAESFH